MILDTTKFRPGATSMPYNESARAWNISLEDIIVTDNVRGHFHKILPLRDTIIKQQQDILEDRQPLLKQACLLTISNEWRALYVKEESLLHTPLVFKIKSSNKIVPLQNYLGKHLLNSAIRCILDGNDPIDQLVTKAVYLLYYYWFFKSDNISNLTNNVMIDIENMIALLIGKGYKKVYRNSNSGIVVEALRKRLDKERMLHIANEIGSTYVMKIRS